MNICTALKAQAQSTILMQPRNRAFHDPTIHTQATPMWSEAACNDGTNVTLAQLLPMRIRIIAPVGIQGVRTASGTPTFAFHRRNAINQGQQLGDIMPIGTRQDDHQRNALRIREEVMLAARFGFIGGIGTDFAPPAKARMELLSATARDQSMRSASCNWSKSR